MRDVLSRVIGLAVFCGALYSASAASIFYESFEAPAVSGTVSNSPTGWVSTRTDKTGLSDAALTGKTGSQFAHVDDYPNDGLHDGALTTTSSILSSNLQAYIRYALTCDMTASDKNMEGTIELLAGTNVLGSDSVTTTDATKNDLSAIQLRIDFMAQPGHPNLGETLAVRISNTAGGWSPRVYFDNVNLDATDTASDSTPPTPDPMTWVQNPTPAGSNSIIMTCSTASDTNWVEYMFSNTVNSTTSGWIEDTTWQDNGLTHGVTYSYQVKARDKGTNKNETAWSTSESATCNSNIVFYDSFEYPLVSSETSGTDPYLWNDASPTGNRAGLGASLSGSGYSNYEGNQAAWLNVYNATPVLETTTANLNASLLANYRYALRFTAAASSTDYTLVADLLAGTNVVLTAQKQGSSKDFGANVASNAFLPQIGDAGVGEALKLRLRVTYTGYPWSQQSYIDDLLLVAEPSAVDFTAPTPDPMTWVQVPTPSGSNGMYMVCSTATDINYVAYMFSNTVNGTTSGWIDDPIWRDFGLTDGVTYSYKVKVRDRSVNSNETAWSSEESAVADKDIIFYESFEYPIVAGTQTGTDPEGWSDLSTGANGPTRAGLGNTLTADGYSNYEGNQAAWLNVYNSTPELQTTSANFDDVFVPACDYTLQFDAADSSTYVLYADLLAGTNVVMTASVTPSSKNFASHLALQNYTSDIGDAGIGEALSVRLRVTGGAWNQQSYIDDLKLSGVRTNGIWNIRSTNVTDSAVDIVGALTATGVNVYVSAYWGTTDGGTDPGAWANTNHLGWYNSVDFLYLTNSISSGLSENTAFYFAFRGSNGWEIWDTTSGVFTTPDVDLPVVDNSTGATSASLSAATLRGELTNGLFANAWICWGRHDGGTGSTGDWDNVASIGWVSQDTEFSTLAVGLATNTTYWYRSYAANSLGEDWSDAAAVFSGSPAGAPGAGGSEPYFEWDAANDTAGDDTWSSTTTNTYDWVFEAGSQSPINVSDARFDLVTKAYSFPGALDQTNTNWNAYGSDEKATFEFVLDADTDNGMFFETGGSGDGIKFEIVGGALRGMLAEGTDVTVSYALTSVDTNRYIHVVYVADNENDVFQLYVDGHLKDSQTWSAGEDWSGTDSAGLGGGDSSEPDDVDPGDFTGKIALFRYYRNTALTAAEVVTNYMALSSERYPIGGAGFVVDAGQDDGANSIWEDVSDSQATGFDAILDTSPAVTWGAVSSALRGITAAYDFPGGNTGIEGGATLSDATGDSFQNSADGDWTTEDVTLEVWFKPADLNTASNNGEIVFEDGGGTGIGFYMNDNLLQLRKLPNSGLVSFDVTGLEADFIQGVGTYDVTSGELELYVNGSSKGTSTAAGGDWSGGDGAALGGRGDANAGGLGGGDSDTTGFDGQIALFRAYRNTILTPEQIALNYDSTARANVSIFTTAPTNVSESAASFNASLTSPNTNCAVYVHWGTSDNGTNFGWGSSAYIGTWTNVVSTNLTYAASGLQPSTTNYYTFRASNDAGNVWAEPSWAFVAGPATDLGSVFIFR